MNERFPSGIAPHSKDKNLDVMTLQQYADREVLDHLSGYGLPRYIKDASSLSPTAYADEERQRVIASQRQSGASYEEAIEFASNQQTLRAKRESSMICAMTNIKMPTTQPDLIESYEDLIIRNALRDDDVDTRAWIMAAMTLRGDSDPAELDFLIRQRIRRLNKTPAPFTEVYAAYEAAQEIPAHAELPSGPYDSDTSRACIELGLVIDRKNDYADAVEYIVSLARTPSLESTNAKHNRVENEAQALLEPRDAGTLIGFLYDECVWHDIEQK